MSSDEDTSRRRPSSPSRSSTAGKAYSSRGEPRRPYVARLPDSTYTALMDASAATGVSANLLVSEAVEAYLSSDRLAARLDEARSEQRTRSSKTDEAMRRQQAAIEKLAGG